MNNKERNTDNNSYKDIARSNTLFGGVQLYQILIQVLKSKFVALFLGTTGVGIMGLLSSGLLLIKNITSMGLSTSAVRDVSEANGSGENQRVVLIVTVLRKIVLFTGLLGTIATTLLSPILSKSLFGNYDYTVAFIILSITLFFDQISSGQLVVLQGLRKYSHLTKASAYGSTIGMLITVPIYYIWGVSGIVPTLILTSISQLLISFYFSKKIKIEKISVDHKTIINEGRRMVSMGFFLSLNTVLATACAFVVRSFINHFGGTDIVGLYTAGLMIVDTYFGLVFTALATDYYPRVAEVCNDNTKCNDIANKQGEIATLLLGPLLIGCIIFMPSIVRLLYSGSFDATCDFIIWASTGILFRLASWLISNQFVAKGDTKLFVLTEFSSRVYFLLFNLLFYYLDGLRGLGVSCSISYLLFSLQVYFVARKKYGFAFQYNLLKLFGLFFLLMVISMGIVMICGFPQRYIYGGIVLLIALYISYNGLEERIAISDILKKLFLHK